MKIYFLRHGDAEERQPGLSDAQRQLTAAGIEEMRAVGKGMAALDLRLDTILTSPLIRAAQTAGLAAEALGLMDHLREDQRLASGARFADLDHALQDEKPTARVLLVGHEPDFSSLIAELIGGGNVRIKKAALACVDVTSVSRGAGELRWLLEPEQLVQLGGS